MKFNMNNFDGDSFIAGAIFMLTVVVIVLVAYGV